jgi:hypothetical protein
MAKGPDDPPRAFGPSADPEEVAVVKTQAHLPDIPLLVGRRSLASCGFCPEIH